jgi:hypothetical protein
VHQQNQGLNGNRSLGHPKKVITEQSPQ